MEPYASNTEFTVKIIEHEHLIHFLCACFSNVIVFAIYNKWIKQWNRMAIEAILKGLHLDYCYK